MRLNPNDNHGLRDVVVNELLAQNNNHEALDVIQQYPDEGTPSMVFGHILALFRLGEAAKALNALIEANHANPKIAKWLLPARKAEPKTTSSYGIQVGGDEEAWLYREDMRDVWDATPGAMAWLKKHSH